jgi:hypothetical protein
VLHLSSFHGGLRFDRPMSAMVVLPYPYPQRTALLAVTFVAAGALLAAAFGFGVIHAMRRTGSSLVLAAMAGVAALQAIVESLRPLFDYPYPLHAWRMSAIWGLAAAFAVLLVSYVATRFLPKARGLMIGLALGVVGATALLPGFDVKTVWALILGVALAALPAAAGVRQRAPARGRPWPIWRCSSCWPSGFPEWLADLSYFLLAAGLVLPLLMVEVVRLGRDDRGREAALTRAASRPDRLTVASARGVELVADRRDPGRGRGRRLCRAAAGRRPQPAARRAPGRSGDPAAGELPAHPPLGDRQPGPRPAPGARRRPLAAAPERRRAPARQPLPPARPARGPGRLRPPLLWAEPRHIKHIRTI